MNKVLKITLLTLFLLLQHFSFAQQNTAKNGSEKKSADYLTRIDQQSADLKAELEMTEYKKSQTTSERDLNEYNATIARIKDDQQKLETKRRKIAALENNISSTRAKYKKLSNDQDTEYKKNRTSNDQTILKQRAALKDQANDQYQLELKQQAELDKLMNTP